ncbi:MAG: hypothetical protein KBG38_08610 [Candidatus Cloacimonas sp.]|nr:hypothetical protein [Candidatus Cloacimonas sp.]
MPYKIYNQAIRDKKRRKKRQGMQVDNRSIFTIVATMVHKAKKGAKKSEKQ